ncbi:Fasciclin-domain-containing protein [Gonapodya prolifera JEL478]|uniref:Fasciclin-domain-containing protein n=1 Tax=Gonapodya prolifera (strain JEL478) TaxID=1344416 RepID=A0A139AJH5_GONPJ|nr:Fasciclin-domain-containing protein [Gonapodya prolifera JEL478]|eukprot:KXS16555.1 Fasciclin-domain-containing protein [Gonapodya prolifera JEL478]
MRITNVFKAALFAPLVAIASAQGTLLSALSGTVPAGKAYNLTTLQSLVSEAALGKDLFTQLGAALGGGANLTVFAPTDTAFASALTLLGGLDKVLPIAGQVLSYHVSTQVVDTAYLKANTLSYIPTLLGNSSLASIKPQVLKLEVKLPNVTVSGLIPVNVIDSIVTSNGVIHVVDGVLLPPGNASATLTAFNSLKDNVVAFNQLAAALDSQNLTTAVNTVTPITIFAPVDSAFAAVAKAVPADTLTKVLKTVLTYHVIAGAAAYLPPSGSYQTFQGENITVVTNGTSVKVNNANVLATVLLSNGVVHVLDAVLVPPTVAASLGGNSTASAPPAASGSASASAPAATGMCLVFVLCRAEADRFDPCRIGTAAAKPGNAARSVAGTAAGVLGAVAAAVLVLA